MNVVDILIILVLIMGAAIGFKQGAIQRITSFVGLFAVIILSFMFKNDLSVIMYETLPFFDLFGPLKDLEVLNIMVYEILAFALIFITLTFALKVLMVISGLLEGLLKLTIILRIPSKILGIFVGAVEAYVYIFIGLFILSLPLFNIQPLKESEYANRILTETPVLNSFAKDTLVMYDGIEDIVKDSDKKTKDELNKELMIFMLDKKIVTYNSTMKLIDSNKLHFKDITFIEKYK